MNIYNWGPAIKILNLLNLHGYLSRLDSKLWDPTGGDVFTFTLIWIIDFIINLWKSLNWVYDLVTLKWKL